MMKFFSHRQHTTILLLFILLGLLLALPLHAQNQFTLEGESLPYIMASDSPPHDSCSYYDELEASTSCGSQGYVQSFAKPYCQAYLYRQQQFSLQAQRILRDIRFCLQNVLRARAEDMTCQQIENYGIASHEYCYLKFGYCHLPFSDLMKVFWIARGEITNLRIWSLVLQVHSQCPSAF